MTLTEADEAPGYRCDWLLSIRNARARGDRERG